MEVALGLGVVGQAAAVAQLIGIAARLIAKIIGAVKTAQLNKLECEQLGRRLSTIRGVLSTLPEDLEAEPPLKELNYTLQEADNMVVACQNRNAARQFFGARHHADCFRQVNDRIMSDITVLNLLLSSFVARRQSNQILHPSHTGVLSTKLATVPSLGSSSSSGSQSHALQTQKVVSQSRVSSIFEYPMIFTWAEIAAVTNNFADELGGGCSGTVYNGRLHNGGREVAVKMLGKHGRQSMEDAFMAEYEIRRTLRHDHIVGLVGWCTQEDMRVFVYDYMSNGTLRDHLQRLGGGSSSSPVTTSWEARIQVLLGASRAIQYLHGGAEPPVIHRNVSSSNILLDASWTPRMASFGSAVFQEVGDEHGGQPVAEVVGTFGYIDPEYVRTRRVSPASDVYSFGVVILEALTGRPPVSGSWEKSEEAVTLVDSALPAMKIENLRHVLDGLPSLKPTPQQLKALELVAHTARCCLWPDGKDRPAMSNVVADLETALGIIRSNEPKLLCY